MFWRKLKLTLIPICSLILLMSSNEGRSQDSITWVKNDLIPFYIKDGPFQGQGISDKLTVFFQSRLPQYKHTQSEMNFSRFYALAERGDLVCNPLLLKTPEREKMLHYSRAFKPAYAHVLVANHPHKDNQTSVQFANLLEHNHHGLIIQKNRSYGPILDRLINQADQAGHIERFTFPTDQLMVMLEKNRIQHFLDVESTVTYYKRLNPVKRKLYTQTLKEDRLDRFGYAVCSKTEAGQNVINAINDVIEREAHSAEFREIIESWLADESKPRFRRFYEENVLATLN